MSKIAKNMLIYKYILTQLVNSKTEDQIKYNGPKNLDY